jgi:serine phosphatase RsbU (regulator of sigma subunit)
MIARRLIRLYILTLTLVTVLVYVVHTTAERSIIGEVRKLLAGVANTAAQGLMAMPNFSVDFQQIDGSLDPLDVHDSRHAAFRRFAAYLENVQDSFQRPASTSTPHWMAPRITYVYTLRRVRPTDQVIPIIIDEDRIALDERDAWQFVVDAVWYDRDENGDGIITADEEGVPPGLIYREAVDSPMLEVALRGPTADEEFHSDIWGTWMSGYAPLLDESGIAVGVLGVDLSREDLLSTLLSIRLVSAGGWLILLLVITLAFHFLSGRLHAFDELERLDEQLETQNAELRATNRRLADANAEFARQLQLAQRVQQGFLPAAFPRTEHIAFDSIYLACEAVGGDIYDVFPIDDSHMGLYIADVSGHGISAALIGATLKMSVEAMKTAVSASGHKRASILYRPRDMIVRLHSILCENLSREHFITMQYAVISTDTNTMTLCNAGHTRPILWSAAARTAELVRTNSGLPIGYLSEEVLVEQELRLFPGDKIILYTDGLTETIRPNTEDDLFGEERLQETVATHGGEDAEALVVHIREAVDAFGGGVPSADDIALVIAEILSNGSEPV